MKRTVHDRGRPTAAERGNGGAQVVFPPDTRARVNPTTMFPQQCIGLITAQFPNGASYTGTGTLIDPFHVLTCAHVLFSSEDGDMATQVTFAPARNQAVAPYGTFASARGGIMIPDEYGQLAPPTPGGGEVDYTQYLYDFGLVRLRTAVNLQQHPAPHAASDAALTGIDCSITGYPGDKPAGTMWGALGTVTTEPTDAFLFYRISTYPGQSGSAVMGSFRFPVPGIVGIHVAGTAQGLETNFAVRLNQDVIERINLWM